MTIFIILELHKLPFETAEIRAEMPLLCTAAH